MGPVKVKELESLKIRTILDLLEYRPSDYIYPGTTPIRDLRVGEQALIQGTVVDIRRLPSQVPIVAAIEHWLLAMLPKPGNASPWYELAASSTR